MNNVLACLLLLATLLPAAANQGKSDKPPEVRVDELTAVRREGLILVDGLITVTSERPLRGLVVMFDFLAPGKQVISTQKTTASKAMLEAGDEVEFYVQAVDHVRAVSIRLHSKDTRGADLRLEDPGPYPIE